MLEEEGPGVALLLPAWELEAPAPVEEEAREYWPQAARPPLS